MKKAVKIIVRGIIPGMFFSNYVKENAKKLGLNGFVRELDGNIAETVIEGEIDDVDKMSKICSEGTKHTIIKEVEIKEISFQDFKEFKVLHI